MKGWIAGYSQDRGDTHLTSLQACPGTPGHWKGADHNTHTLFRLLHVSHLLLSSWTPNVTRGARYEGGEKESLMMGRVTDFCVHVYNLVHFVTLNNLKGTNTVAAAILQITGVSGMPTRPGHICTSVLLSSLEASQLKKLRCCMNPVSRPGWYM